MLQPKFAKILSNIFEIHIIFIKKVLVNFFITNLRLANSIQNLWLPIFRNYI